MKVYAGNVGAIRQQEILKEKGYGTMISDCYRSPIKYPYYAIDNGAYTAYVNKTTWDEKKFLNLLKRYMENDKKPDFIVVPDLVAQGKKSLLHSLDWIPKMPKNIRLMLAVQDGIEPMDVFPYLDDIGGIFVGGTRKWKYENAHRWVHFAHIYRKPCHIGRVGTFDKIVWASRIEADSIDSASWSHHDTFYYVESASKQSILSLAGRQK